MAEALFTGTFDPPTLGHLDIIKRASLLFGKLYVGVCRDSCKRGDALSCEDRMHFLKEITTGMANVEVIVFSGLAVDCALERSVSCIVRGIRNVSDFDFEVQMAMTNRQLAGIETVLLIGCPGYAHMSSTFIREIAMAGRRLTGFVPDKIEEAVWQKLSKKSHANLCR